MNACNICQATDAGVLNAAALTTEQLDQLNTASVFALRHFCATCIHRLSTPFEGQVHECTSKGAASWAACWAATQDGQRRFIHLGEKNKGDAGALPVAYALIARGCERDCGAALSREQLVFFRLCGKYLPGFR